MPTDSRSYSEAEVKALVKEHIERAERRQVRSVGITYDRPAHPTPTDPGAGLTIRVEFGDSPETENG